MFDFGGHQSWGWLLWVGIIAILYYLYTGTALV